MLLCILLVPYAESLAPLNSSCAVRIHMLDFYGLSRAIPIANHDKKAAEPKLAQLGIFSYGFFSTHGRFFSNLIFLALLIFFGHLLKSPCITSSLDFFYLLFFLLLFIFSSLELLENLYPLLLYYKYGQSIHHLHHMLIFFALS